MKFQKLLSIAIISFLAVSCSQDTFEEPSVDVPNERLAYGQYDNSHLGLYKGLFTTNDGLTRGSVEITLTPSNEGIATITLSSGEVIQLRSAHAKLTVDNIVNNLHFSSEGLSDIDASLNFTVNGDGSNSLISDVLFDAKESDILIAKNLSRVPLTPITGTFDCTNCASVGIGFPNGRTWNVMTIGAGNEQHFEVQVAYGGRVYTSPAANNSQNACQTIPTVATICQLEGDITILTHSVSWDGTHIYDDSDITACSQVEGIWTAPSYGPGINGTFQSDTTCF